MWNLSKDLKEERDLASDSFILSFFFFFFEKTPGGQKRDSQGGKRLIWWGTVRTAGVGEEWCDQTCISQI